MRWEISTAHHMNVSGSSAAMADGTLFARGVRPDAFTPFGGSLVAMIREIGKSGALRSRSRCKWPPYSRAWELCRQKDRREHTIIPETRFFPDLIVSSPCVQGGTLQDGCRFLCARGSLLYPGDRRAIRSASLPLVTIRSCHQRTVPVSDNSSSRTIP